MNGMRAKQGDSLSQLSFWTIWVMRPDDAEPWCWGGSYDDDTGPATEKHVQELESKYPGWVWAKRRDRGSNGHGFLTVAPVEKAADRG